MNLFFCRLVDPLKYRVNFEIDSSTGVVSVVSAFDREELSSSVGSNVVSVSIQVFGTNINELPPLPIHTNTPMTVKKKKKKRQRISTSYKNNILKNLWNRHRHFVLVMSFGARQYAVVINCWDATFANDPTLLNGSLVGTKGTELYLVRAFQLHWMQLSRIAFKAIAFNKFLYREKICHKMS